MPPITPPERIFLLVIGLVTVVGTGLARVAPRRPEAFPGLAVPHMTASEMKESSRLSFSEEEDRSEGDPCRGGVASLLEEQILLVEEALARRERERGDGARHPHARSTPLELNQASAAELRSLRGIGPVLAERIVQERRERGPFQRVDDLVRVKGIGPCTVDDLRGLLVVTSP